MLLERLPVSVGVLAGFVIALTGAFVLSLPRPHSPIDQTRLRAPNEHHSLAEVHRVFADYGIRLHYTSHPSRRLTVLGVVPPPYAQTALYVSVTRSGRVEARYGGVDERVRRRVRAALSALARR